MIGFVRWLCGFILMSATILFALANRQSVPLIWSPVHSAIDVPIFLPVLIGVAAGFVLGSLIVWINNSPLRHENRQQRKIIKALEQDIETLSNRPLSPPSLGPPQP